MISVKITHINCDTSTFLCDSYHYRMRAVSGELLFIGWNWKSYGYFNTIEAC